MIEIDGIVLLNEQTGESLKLDYPQAAIWDLLSRDDSMRSIVAKLAAIASLEPETAERLTAETVARLQKDGFLIPRGMHG